MDNSDVNFITGSGANARIQDNMVFMAQNYAFGGMMCDNFNGCGRYSARCVLRNIVVPLCCVACCLSAAHVLTSSVTVLIPCSATDGIYTGMVLSGNTVQCNARCHYGIELGPHAWYQVRAQYSLSLVVNPARVSFLRVAVSCIVGGMPCPCPLSPVPCPLSLPVVADDGYCCSRCHTVS